MAASGPQAASLEAAPRQGAFEVKAFEGKGLGCVATRQLHAGDLLLGERPVLTFTGGDANWVASLDAQFDQLSDARKEAVMGLHDAHCGSGRQSVAGIMSSNTFMRGMGSSDGVLCEVASRFNHSCLPNCEHSWDEEANELQVYASTDIAEGEELCIHYIDVRAPAGERAPQFVSFGFRCRCPACSGATAEADGRRRRLQELVRGTGPTAVKDPGAALAMVEEAMALYDEEGIHVNQFKKGACYYAFQLCLRLQDMPAARVWIERASTYSVLCHGPGHATTALLRRYAEDPGSHPAAESVGAA